MNIDEDTVFKQSILKRFCMNTSLSAARIFDEESNESTKSGRSSEVRGSGKMKSLKKNVKKSPYKSTHTKRCVEYETDKTILERRQKQIDYGRNTIGYDNYRKLVPSNKRTAEHPRTPVKHLKYSRRGWDGLIRTWRQKLHEFDPEGADDDKDDKSSTDDDSDTKILESTCEDFVNTFL